jgi:hypothetical protein
LLLEEQLQLLLLLLLLLLMRHVQGSLLEEQLIKRSVRLSLELAELLGISWGLTMDGLGSQIVCSGLISSELGRDLLILEKL